MKQPTPNLSEEIQTEDNKFIVWKEKHPKAEFVLSFDNGIIEILRDANSEDFEIMADFFNVSTEQIEVAVKFVQEREQIYEKMKQDIELRWVENPLTSQEELDMGVYIESIEPQVSEAVLSFRKKGYNTSTSGSCGLGDKQRIGFEDELGDIVLDEKFIEELKEKGVNVEIGDKIIDLIFKKFTPLQEIIKIWDELISFLPDLDTKAEECSAPRAKRFRENQNKLKYFESPESVHSKEKIKSVFENLLGLDDWETLEEINDERGLCVWSIKASNKDGSHKEYEYKRGGMHKGRKPSEIGHVPQDDIYCEAIDKDGRMDFDEMGLVAIYKDKVWRNAEKSDE